MDDRFDSLNSVTNIKGTSYLMGNGGSFTGDPTPGSRTTVQRTNAPQPNRDWRDVGFVLPVQFWSFLRLQTIIIMCCLTGQSLPIKKSTGLKLNEA
ncbi:MAG: hypothetical protein IPL84_00230 [Chitinophagaceae bacterium]|nr:hypothetical protein [Chitinophagaceae bacterium]